MICFNLVWTNQPTHQPTNQPQHDMNQNQLNQSPPFTRNPPGPLVFFCNLFHEVKIWPLESWISQSCTWISNRNGWLGELGGRRCFLKRMATPKIPGYGVTCREWTMSSRVDRCLLATYWQVVMDKLDGSNPAPDKVGSLFYQVSAKHQQWSHHSPCSNAIWDIYQKSKIQWNQIEGPPTYQPQCCA